ncbi:hypothetical protein ABZ958_03390 [Streptomyces sp. NPDC046237]|uniref:hypothetical protein n=1 Tax=Streptomyces sp. NPDC046237 TaxID=3154914 RepID=UPI0033DD2863
MVGEVLASHKDDILEEATSEVAWDSAWEQTASAQQEIVCDRLKTDGVEAVAKEMADGKDSPSGDEAVMAQYFLDEKCPQL